MRAAGALDDTLLLVQHPPVVTYGANFHEDSLLLSGKQYEAAGIDVIRTDRGGDVTYHGPKQLVIYPIFSVKEHGADLHKWLRDLEETIIVALGNFGLEGYRFPPNTGVWVGGRKIAAIGIRVAKWVSVHGIALNCANDLSPFGLIVPCGIKEWGVTSLSKELNREVGVSEALPTVLSAFQQVFNIQLEPKARETMLKELDEANGKTA